MAGKNTAKAGSHPSRGGGWVTQIKLDEYDIEELNNNLGRSLADGEIGQIEQMLKTTLGLKNATGETVTNQDVIATLKAFTSADDAMVMQYFNDCDEDSLLKIEEIFQLVMRVNFLDKHPPERIRAAAALALTAMKSGKNGAPEKGYRNWFYHAVLHLWHELGCQDDAVWETEGKSTPLNTFAWNLLNIIEPKTCPTLSTVAKDLRKVRDGKVNA